MLCSSFRRGILLMAAESQRSRNMTVLQVAASKRSKTLMTNTAASASDSEMNSMNIAFSNYTAYLNDLNDKRERVVKASRDVTMNSKKVIFQVHRLNKYNKEEVLEKAEKDLALVLDRHISHLIKQLQGSDFWKLRRAYSPGVQEYVEAATFLNFCKNGTLLSLDEINSTFQPLSDSPFAVNLLDYLLGVADLTGELMRLAIGRISDGELEFAKKICRFARVIHRELILVVPKMDDTSDMNMKMETMLQSVIKIENACFSVHVRGSEYVPFLGSEDASFRFSGMPDIE